MKNAEKLMCNITQPMLPLVTCAKSKHDTKTQTIKQANAQYTFTIKYVYACMCVCVGVRRYVIVSVSCQKVSIYIYIIFILNVNRNFLNRKFSHHWQYDYQYYCSQKTLIVSVVLVESVKLGVTINDVLYILFVSVKFT